MSAAKERKLVEVRSGGGVYRLTASINGDGALVLAGYDSTSAGSMMGGDDYEYWYTIPADRKDDLLLDLLQAVSDSKDVTTSTKLKAFLNDHDIAYEFSSWR